MTSFFYFNSMELSLLPEKEEFQVEYQGKPFFFILSSNRMKKKRSRVIKTLLEISLDFESKDYMECLQANLRWLLFEKKERDDQLNLFFLDKSETPKTAAKCSLKIPEEPFSGKVILHLSKVLPDKAFLGVSQITMDSIIEPSFLFDYYEESDNEELETFLRCIQ